MNKRNLSPSDIVRAHQLIAGQIKMTPVMSCSRINELLGLEAFFKCEHLQTTGSFKFRGASHAVCLLNHTCQGVATHSSGNHGAALAKAARARGMMAHIVMPETAVKSKIQAVRDFGGQVHFCAPNQRSREAGLARLIELGLEPVPPYEDDRIIAGQGTCALELLEQVPNLDVIMVPVGGGGLLAGTALAAMTQARPVQVIGVEPAGADDTARSLKTGHRVEDHHPKTIADGLRALVGQANLAIIAEHVKRVILVEDKQIIEAMTVLWSLLKQVVEPSGAVALAGIMKERESFAGARVGIVLSGGNLDIAPLLETLE
jgi:threonine dehydratase